jgi:hypothetical protein
MPKQCHHLNATYTEQTRRFKCDKCGRFIPFRLGDSDLERRRIESDAEDRREIDSYGGYHEYMEHFASE